MPLEQDWPKIKSVSVDPQEIMINRLSAGAIPPQDRTIKVSVMLEPIDMNHHNCFLVQVSVAGNTYLERLPSNDSALTFPDITLPDDVVHGQMALTATAQLVFTNAPEIAAGVEKSAKFDIAFQPGFPEQVMSVATGEHLTVTVPVTFAAQIPGFAPKFGFFPDEFDPFSTDPPGPNRDPGGSTADAGCPDTGSLDEVLKSYSEATDSNEVSEFVMSYTVAVDRNTIERCGYTYLLTMWSSSDKEGHAWINLAAMGTDSGKPTITPVSPSPIPTSPGGNGGGGNGNGAPGWVWILGLVIFIVIILLLLKLWLTKRHQ